MKRGLPRSPVIPRLGRLRGTRVAPSFCGVAATSSAAKNAGPDVPDVSSPGEPTVLELSVAPQ